MRELSKKRKKAVPVQELQNESGTVFRQSGVEAALAQIYSSRVPYRPIYDGERPSQKKEME